MDKLWITGMERQKICPTQLLSLLSFYIFSSLFFCFFVFFAILETDGCVKCTVFSTVFPDHSSWLAMLQTLTHRNVFWGDRHVKINILFFFFLYLCNSASVCLCFLPTIPIWKHSSSIITTKNGYLSPHCNATWLLIGRCGASQQRQRCYGRAKRQREVQPVWRCL